MTLGYSRFNLVDIPYVQAYGADAHINVMSSRVCRCLVMFTSGNAS